jgi:AcrR family transcriptional regulator
VPKLWNDTIETHRQAVREAILDAAASLAAEHGVTSVSMSRIAEESGIGRATLYKYFSDVEAILIAWHKRQIVRHLDHLSAVRDAADTPKGRLRAVLEAYALIAYAHHGTELSTFLHAREHAAHAQQHLHGFVRSLIADAVKDGGLRSDVAPDELASYCLASLEAARRLGSKAATRRLVAVVLDGLSARPS